jgi:hypothetical protein
MAAPGINQHSVEIMVLNVAPIGRSAQGPFVGNVTP